MKFENVIYKEKDKVAWILLNRPEAMNALSMKLAKKLTNGKIL